MKLRAPHISDIDAILRWENDPNVQLHSSSARNYTYAEIKEFIDRNDNLIDHGQQRWMILDQHKKAVGCIDLYDFCTDEQMAYVGILVYENQRSGIGCEALKSLAQYVRSVYRLKELRSIIPEENIASIRCFEKAGYRREVDNVFGIRL